MSNWGFTLPNWWETLPNPPQGQLRKGETESSRLKSLGFCRQFQSGSMDTLGGFEVWLTTGHDCYRYLIRMSDGLSMQNIWIRSFPDLLTFLQLYTGQAIFQRVAAVPFGVLDQRQDLRLTVRGSSQKASLVQH
jgi:hypothetical protein